MQLPNYLEFGRTEESFLTQYPSFRYIQLFTAALHLKAHLFRGAFNTSNSTVGRLRLIYVTIGSLLTFLHTDKLSSV